MNDLKVNPGCGLEIGAGCGINVDMDYYNRPDRKPASWWFMLGFSLGMVGIFTIGVML